MNMFVKLTVTDYLKNELIKNLPEDKFVSMDIRGGSNYCQITIQRLKNKIRLQKIIKFRFFGGF